MLQFGAAGNTRIIVDAGKVYFGTWGSVRAPSVVAVRDSDGQMVGRLQAASLHWRCCFPLPAVQQQSSSVSGSCRLGAEA